MEKKRGKGWLWAPAAEAAGFDKSFKVLSLKFYTFSGEVLGFFLLLALI